MTITPPPPRPTNHVHSFGQYLIVVGRDAYRTAEKKLNTFSSRMDVVVLDRPKLATDDFAEGAVLHCDRCSKSWRVVERDYTKHLKPVRRQPRFNTGPK